MPSLCNDLTPVEHMLLRVLTDKRHRSGRRQDICDLDVEGLARLVGTPAPSIISGIEGLVDVGAVYNDNGYAIQEPCRCDAEVFSSDSYGVFSYSSGRRTDSSIPRDSSSSRTTDSRGGLSGQSPPGYHPSTDSSSESAESTRGWDGDLVGVHPLRKALILRCRHDEPSTWSAPVLAYYFGQTLRRMVSSTDRAAGRAQTNEKALAASLSRWMKFDGVTPVEIKQMIDWFFDNLGKHRRRRKPYWSIFLSERVELWEATAEGRKRDWMEESSQDKEAWSRTNIDASSQDKEYWGGRKTVRA